MSDTGNLFGEGTGPSFSYIANYPYGMNFGRATYRCSDCSLMIDYFGGLDCHWFHRTGTSRRTLPPGQLRRCRSDRTGQVVLHEQGITVPFTNSSLDVQLQWFKNSLFFVGEIGGNDYNYAFFSGSSIDEVKTFVPTVVGEIIQSAEKLIAAGAVNLVVPGNHPIGCMPSYLTLFRTNDTAAYDGNNCLKDLIAFALYHNQPLQDSLTTLRKKYPQVGIMYGDYYNFISTLLGKFDKGSVLKGLLRCRRWRLQLQPTASCGANGTTICDVPAKSLSWDGVHLTGEVYKLMSDQLTFGGKTFPGNQNWNKWVCYKKVITS